MSVEVTVTWNFVRDGEQARVSYPLLRVSSPLPSQQVEDKEVRDPLPSLSSVIPLSTSVLAPGLSMPVLLPGLRPLSSAQGSLNAY
jgi:hypothetical protein